MEEVSVCLWDAALGARKESVAFFLYQVDDGGIST